MIAKLIILIAVGQSVLCSDVMVQMNHTGLLEEAVNYLVEYTAAETEKALDALDIETKVTDIARQQFDARIGKRIATYVTTYVFSVILVPQNHFLALLFTYVCCNVVIVSKVVFTACTYVQVRS